MPDYKVMVKKYVLKDNMKCQEEKVLTYCIEYPEFLTCKYRPALIAINKFYRCRAHGYQRYARDELFPLAAEQLKESREHNDPVFVFEALSEFNVTYNRGCVISLYSDRYEFTGGAHGSTVRSAQTWNTDGRGRVCLRELFACEGNEQEYIFEEIIRQIQMEPDIYFEDYERLVTETFDQENFYCTEQGVVIYFQQYDIAPYSSGIREFLFPYSDIVHSPLDLCRTKQ